MSWSYFIVLFFMLPVSVWSFLFGVDYTLAQFVLLESKVKLLCASLISYPTLFSAFLKTKFVNSFVQTRLGFDDKFERIPNNVSFTSDDVVETFGSCQLSSAAKNHITLEDYIITLEKANRVASCLRLLEDQSAVKHVKRLSREPLVSYYSLPGTSENCDIWALKVWSDVEASRYKSPYVFSGGLNYDKWSLETILNDLNLDADIIEIAHVSERYKTRKIYSVNGLGTLIYALQDVNNLAKVQRWLFKYGMLHNKSVINSYNIVNVRKLLYPLSCTYDMIPKNFWLSNAECVPIKARGYKSIYSERNVFPTIQEAIIHTSVNYERGYHWFLKRLYFLNANNVLDNKISPIVNKSLVKLTNSINFTRPIRGCNNFLKTTTSLQQSPMSNINSVSSVNDVFYHSPSDLFHNQNTLALLNTILSNQGSPSISNKSYMLSSYSSILNDSFVDYKIYLSERRDNWARPPMIWRFKVTYFSFMRFYVAELKRHRGSRGSRGSKVLVRGDFANTQYLMDNYRSVTSTSR